MHRFVSFVSFIAAAALATSPARRASAHASPHATGIEWFSNGTIDRIVVRSNHGLMVSDDGGASFKLLCNEALDLGVSDVAPLVFTPEGELLAGTYSSGLIRSRDGLCSWEQVTGTLRDWVVYDLKGNPAVPATAYVVAPDPATQKTTTFMTRDSGETWEPLAPSGEIVVTRLAVAPSDPERLYRSGAEFHPMTLTYTQYVSSSSDGGITFEDHPIAIAENELVVMLLGVDPTNADRVFARVQATSLEFPERVILSEDGGRTFETVLSALDLEAFATSPDGGTVWVGSSEGLYRSSDAGRTFEQVSRSGMRTVDCLGFHEGELYACGIFDDRFTVRVSGDGGDSFRPFLEFGDVDEQLECPAQTEGAVLCDGPFAQWLVERPDSPNRDAGAPPAPDASDSPAATDPGTSGCGCETVARPRNGALAGLPVIVALGMAARRVRRARRVSPG